MPLDVLLDRVEEQVVVEDLHDVEVHRGPVLGLLLMVLAECPETKVPGCQLIPVVYLPGLGGLQLAVELEREGHFLDPGGRILLPGVEGVVVYQVKRDMLGAHVLPPFVS